MKRRHLSSKLLIRRSLGRALGWMTLTCLALSPSGPASAFGEVQKKVLVIHGSRRDLPAIETADRVFQKTLSEGLAGTLDYYSEYMDVARSPKPDYQAALRDFLLRKYERPEFRVIIAVADTAFEFVARYGAELFPGTPVVFLGSGKQAVEALRLGPNFTGMFQELDMKSTLDFALRLQPGTKRVFVVSGASDFDRYYEELARQQFQEFEGRLALTYLSGLPLEDVQKAVANLPHDSITYFLMIAEDGAGNRFIPTEALEKISQVATVPIYGWSELHLDHGILGGSLFSPEIIAPQIAKLALRVLHGEKPGDIPITEVKANINVVDWRQLQRWGISENRLPPDSIVRFKEPTFWEQYKWRIVGVISLCIFEALLIVWLLINRNRRRRAEEETACLASRFKAERERLEEVVNNVPGIVWESRIQPGSNTGRTVFVSPYVESMLGYSVEEWLSTPDFSRAIILEEDREEVTREVATILESGKEGILRFRWGARDGRVLWVEAHLAVIRDETGKTVGLRGVTLDITERKQNEQLLQRLTGRLLMLQDEERQRVAAELHDGLGQSLAIIKNRAMIGLGDQTNQDQAIEQLEEISAIATSAILEVREIAHNLRPYELDRLGLVAAIESMIERVSASTSVNLSTDLEGIDGLLSPEAETSVYRIVQEGLNNVLKHSHATAARIEIKKNGKQQLAISVQDNGKGMPPPAPADNGNHVRGFGLAGIAERARLLGGSLAIDSQPTRGTTLAIRLELPAGTRE